MSNHLIDVTATPNSIPTGTTTQVDVEYESDDGGLVQITTGAGFTVSPTSQALGATSNGTVQIPITIARGTATTRSCQMVFHFFDSTPRELLVEVT